MLDWIVSNMVIFWIVCAVIFVAIEGATSGLVTIWFTIGGAAAAIVAALGASVPVQVVVFFAVSVVLLVFTRPIFVKKLRVGKEKNYTEQLEGRTGLVMEAIAPFGSGLVKVNGIIWTAIGETDEFAAAAGDKVEIIRVEGVKLIVK